MKGYYDAEPREGVCDNCGETLMCNRYVSDEDMWQGYRDEIYLCHECDLEEK